MLDRTWRILTVRRTFMQTRRGLRLLALGLLLACVTGCASTQLEPLTSQSEPALLEPQERTLWTTADRIESEIATHVTPAASHEQAEKYLEEVLRKLTPDFSDSRVRVRIRVLPDPNPNAFILPNGAMYVNSGLLALLENEAQLATVLGHEFCHFRNRHSYRERIKEHNEFVKGAIVGGTLGVLSGTPELANSTAELWRISSVSGYSRDLESEADRASLAAMMQAGYQPQEALKAFERLLSVSQEEEDGQDQRFATHPKLSDRIASYRQCVQKTEAQPPASGARAADDVYDDRLFDTMVDNAELNLQEDNYNVARENIERCLKLRPACARAHFLQGELWRKGPSDAENIWERAQECYERSTRHDPNFARAYREAGLLHRQLGDRASAGELLRKYLTLAAGEPDTAIVKSYLDRLDDASEAVKPPYRAPQVTGKNLREKVKTIGLMPVIIPDGILGIEKRKEEFAASLAEGLRQAGFKVVPSSAYVGIHDAMKKSIGAIYDPNSGKLLEDRYDVAVEYALREYFAAHQIDVVAYPAVVIVVAKWNANRASWHGVQEAATGREGFWAEMAAPSAYGTMSALSFRLIVADTYGDTCYVGFGGIQLCSRVTAGGFVDVPAHELLVDPAKNARSVDIACQALKTASR